MECLKNNYYTYNILVKISNFFDKFNDYIIMASDDGSLILIDLLYGEMNNLYFNNYMP
uniref:Uncharacterized protein n=1 Tax=Borely moumouvirus TaxID=2712067 RepID=A0A6G6ABP7_9VIRU